MRCRRGAFHIANNAVYLSTEQQPIAETRRKRLICIELFSASLEVSCGEAAFYCRKQPRISRQSFAAVDLT
jgi:hypothetical protein